MKAIGNLISPDVVVHKFGHDRDNLLVIEAEKKTNSAPDENDLFKRTQIKRPIGYRFSLFLRLPAGANAERANLRIIWVD